VTVFRAATFNANSIRSRLEIVLAWLEKWKPDILCIQETKCQDHDFPREAVESAGWHVAFRGEKSYNGVAIISRRPLEAVRFGLDDGGPADETRLICAQAGGITVVNTYVPQGREIDHAMYAYKLEWLKRLRAYFDRHFKTTEKLIWTGDLNVARTPLDVYDAASKKDHVCYHEAVRAVFEECLAWGFTDVFRKFHEGEEKYSFFDYRAPSSIAQNRGWRIDYILASAPLAKKAKDSLIDMEPRLKPKPSDHTFLVADFEG